MGNLNLDKLAALIGHQRDVLLSRWRAQVRQLPSAKHLDIPTLNDHVPALLDELVTAFHQVADESIPATLLEGTPPAHGLQRHDDGFDIVEVVAEYNILRGCIHDLAEENGLSLSGKSFHILNRIFDEAIGLAVQTFATRQALEVQRRREEYLAFVAHDLRTPLNAVSLAARVLELVNAAQPDNPEVTRMLKTLRRNVMHIEALVDRVLKESAHVQSETGMKLERRELDLWPFVEALIHDMQPLADTANTQLVNEVPEEVFVFADASLLHRVVQNLLANAITHTPRGQVVIRAQKTGDAGAVEVAVVDNGAGIPADRLDVIFEKGESDSQTDGAGLGLAIVKSFVESHGGRVTVESQENAGSTFRITLPGPQHPGGEGADTMVR